MIKKKSIRLRKEKKVKETTVQTAVLFFGQLRRGEKTYCKIKKKIFSFFSSKESKSGKKFSVKKKTSEVSWKAEKMIKTKCTTKILFLVTILKHFIQQSSFTSKTV